MGQGVKHYRNYRTAPAVSTEDALENHGRSPWAVSGLACSQLLQTYLWRASSRADRQIQPPTFKESLSSAFSLQPHMLSFPFLLLYAHSSCDGTLQLIKTTTGSLLLWISYIYLKEGMSDSSSCLFCDISYYNAQWTIVTINTFAISEVKLGLKHELQYLKHLTPIERMTHQDRTVYKTEVAIVKVC